MLKNTADLKGDSSPVVSWLRNEIKSVDSKEEQSAYGLNTPEVVIILKMWNGSSAAQGDGLKSKDVVLQVEGEKVKKCKRVFRNTKKIQLHRNRSTTCDEKSGGTGTNCEVEINLGCSITPLLPICREGEG
jgi:S1-C subfamily serine protease